VIFVALVLLIFFADFVFVGLVSLFSVWRVFYRSCNISVAVMWLCLSDVGEIERDSVYLSHLRVYKVK